MKKNDQIFFLKGAARHILTSDVAASMWLLKREKAFLWLLYQCQKISYMSDAPKDNYFNQFCIFE